ncbi:MAG: BamA/TamA family outer membrane protein [Bacteroidia bacterium]
MSKANLIYCLFFFYAIGVSGCKLTKMVPDDSHLLVNTSIDHKVKYDIDLSDQYNYLSQKPNRRLGPIRFHLRAYHTGARGIAKGKDSTWWRRTLMNIGEPPVIVDSQLCALSVDKLSDYYFSKGYLENEVSYEIMPSKRKKRAGVQYIVNLGDYRKVSSLTYNSTSYDIDKLIDSAKTSSYLKVGKRLDFDDVQKERSRLTSLLKNNGFYYFNSSFIDFSIDTNHVVRGADIQVNIRNNRDYQPHYQQTVEEVIVKIGEGPKSDTSLVEGMKIIENSYYINPEVIGRNIYFRPGELYSMDKVQKTYSSLLSIGLFRFVTIRFAPSASDSLNSVIAFVTLQTASKHDFIWEPQAITTEQGSGIEAAGERNFGVGNNVSLRNRNVFGNAEAFNINISTALESQFKRDSLGALSNFRQSVSTEFVIPSLLFFKNKENDLITKNTRFTASYLYDRNVNYQRHVLPLNFSYNFQQKRTTYAVTPLRISFNRSIVNQEFFESLTPESQTYISQLLTNNLIIGPILSLYWTNKIDHPNNFWTLRSNPVELAGNAFAAYYKLFTNETGFNKEVLGVKYSQYARTELDASYNHIIDENNAFAYRMYTGIGVPFGNTEFLPFERRFFVGGANSLRAWRPRTIGPGAYVDSSHLISIEKTGEIMLQFNAEYRFNIIKQQFLGAVFFDAGNIWNMKANNQFEDGEFQFSQFYKQMAFNTGFGARIDISYIVFRIDLGIALHDPTKQEGKRWVIKEISPKGWLGDHSALNFAVGYPF